jgi:hypothetical protein
MDSAIVAGSCYADSSSSIRSFARLGSSLSVYGGMSCESVSSLSFVNETNLGSKLSAASDVLPMQSLSVRDGFAVFTSLSAVDSFIVDGCFSTTDGSRSRWQARNSCRTQGGLQFVQLLFSWWYMTLGGFNWFISICFIIDGSKMENALLIMIMVWNFDNGLEFRQSF